MTTKRIGIRQLREDLSSALRRVRSGQVIEVTDRGRTVARIVPSAPLAGRLSDLIAQGKAHPPRSARPLPAPLKLRSRMTSEEAIDVLRGG